MAIKKQTRFTKYERCTRLQLHYLLCLFYPQRHRVYAWWQLCLFMACAILLFVVIIFN